MPRPKRTKIQPSQPASRRVAQRTPADFTTPKRRNPAREASSRAEDNSDDSDGLVTSFSQARKRKSRPQLDDRVVMMSGGLGLGDTKGAHIRAGPATGRTEDSGHTKAIEGLGVGKGAPMKGQQLGAAGKKKELESSIDSAAEGSNVAEDTSEVETSVLDIASFKRRARQPEVLQSAVEDQRDDEDEDVFEPEDESTPLQLLTSTSLLQQDPDYASSSPLSLPRPNPRKRKLTSPLMDVLPSSPPITIGLASAVSREGSLSSLPDLLEARGRNREAGSLDKCGRDTATYTPSEIAAPPQSSSPAIRNAYIASDGLPSPSPRQQEASSSPAERQRQHPRRRARQPSQDGVSDVEDLRTEDEGPAVVEVPTRNSRRGGSRNEKAPISTAALQSLLPRRRRRTHPGGFDIMGSSDIDAETTRLNNVSSPLRAKKDTGKRQFIPEGKRPGQGKAGPHGRKGIPGKKRVAATPAAKAPRTYSRRISSDKENDAVSSSPAEEGDSLAPVDSNEATPSHENVKQTKRMLKRVARKFKDVDNWELDFEEVTASSSPLDAR
ncbi:MAG: hypothetical protein M1840_006839 [Geoglossum simile]|nr:MAG: hypothetical protein M1840_006839 [Geoglossum simile]